MCSDAGSHVIQPPLVVVAAALIDAQARIFVQQRPADKNMGGLWEFPGGKLEPGETPEQALIRELDEELGITVKEACLAPLTFATHDYREFHILLALFVCRRWEGTPVPREHDAIRWVRANRLREFPMPPADAPLISHLIDLL